MAQKKLIVIGGGAAGFFCAVNAARLQPNLEVLLLEKSNKFLSKVKVSGGGRCNVTHACTSIADMVKNYPRGDKFLKKAFTQFFTQHCIQWFLDRKVPLKTEADGRMFPLSNSSQTIIDCLLKEADHYRVKTQLQTAVQEIEVNPNGLHRFTLKTTGNKMFTADYICMACGGFPKAEQFNWLKNLGHTIQPPVPSLFTFNMPKHPITGLMGVVVENVQVKMVGTKLLQKGPLLITHWGFSGPAILKLSSLAARFTAAQQYQFSILVNWLPAYNEQTIAEALHQIRFQKAAQQMGTKNPFQLPARLWSFLLQQAQIPETMRWADLPAKQQNILAKYLCNYLCTINGKTTFKEEFVTCGGIDLSEVEVQTMQSKLQPGLYFAGEVLDVDALTGGFNFQNAWTTGFVAANAIAQKL